MPLRNLLWIAATAVFSLVCFAEANRNRYAGIISETIDKIAAYYVEPIDQEKLFEGSMRGMMSELDPYSGFISATQYPQFKAEIEQHFGGIGIEVGIKNDRITILNPVPDLPAYRAGLLAGDVIVGIDGVDVTEASLDEAVKLMRGPIDTEVEVNIARTGEDKPQAFTLTRAQITIESVRGDLRDKRGNWSFVLERNPRIGYIRLTSFGERSTQELIQAIEEVNDSTDGLIMDLRGNAGGLLSAAVDICDLFIPAEQIVVSTRGRVPGIDKEYFSKYPPVFPPNKPLVVLVDRFTASAGEIFAACMQDYQRGVVVGERTWGKGTVQNVIDLNSGRGAIRLTTQSYWRPSGSNIHRSEDAQEDDEWGVSPTEDNLIKFTTPEYQVVFRRRGQRDLSSATATDNNTSDDAAPSDDTDTADRSDPNREGNPDDDATLPEQVDVNAQDESQGAVPGEAPDAESAAKQFPGDRQLDRALQVMQELLNASEGGEEADSGGAGESELRSAA